MRWLLTEAYAPDQILRCYITPMHLWRDSTNYSYIAMVECNRDPCRTCQLRLYFLYFCTIVTWKNAHGIMVLIIGRVGLHPKSSLCIEVSPIMIPNKYVSMTNHTITSATTNVMILIKPQKYPVTVSTCIALIYNIFIPYIFIVLIASWISSKGLSFLTHPTK